MYEVSNFSTSFPTTCFLSLIIAMVGVKLYLIVVLICVFLVTNDVAYLFMHVSTVCIFSLEKCLCESFARFKIGSFLFFACAVTFDCCAAQWFNPLRSFLFFLNVKNFPFVGKVAVGEYLLRFGKESAFVVVTR